MIGDEFVSTSTEYYDRIDGQIEFYRVVLPGPDFAYLSDVRIQDVGQLTKVQGYRVTESGAKKRFRWFGRDWTEL